MTTLACESCFNAGINLQLTLPQLLNPSHHADPLSAANDLLRQLAADTC